jgi:hypothetical protein
MLRRVLLTGIPVKPPGPLTARWSQAGCIAPVNGAQLAVAIAPDLAPAELGAGNGQVVQLSKTIDFVEAAR